MVSAVRQILGLVLAVIGFLGSIVICAFPEWKGRVFNGCGIVASPFIWEGLWMNCVIQSTAEKLCKVYDSLTDAPPDLQAARALVTIAIIVGLSGVTLGIVGGKCTNCVEGERQKCKVAIAAGIMFIIAGLLVLIPVCWTADLLIRHDPILHLYRTELGASLYIGWVSAGLLFLGGGLLCSSCPPSVEKEYEVKYTSFRSVDSSKAVPVCDEAASV